MIRKALRKALVSTDNEFLEFVLSTLLFKSKLDVLHENILELHDETYERGELILCSWRGGYGTLRLYRERDGRITLWKTTAVTPDQIHAVGKEFSNAVHDWQFWVSSTAPCCEACNRRGVHVCECGLTTCCEEYGEHTCPACNRRSPIRREEVTLAYEQGLQGLKFRLSQLYYQIRGKNPAEEWLKRR